MIVIGIDPGCSGAVAALDTESGAVSFTPLPINAARRLDTRRFFFGDLLWGTPQEQMPSLVVTENVWSPKSLVQMVGAIIGVCDIVGVRVEAEYPAVWKRRVLGSNTSDKAVSVAWCKRTFPAAVLRRTPRCKTDWHDAAEAAALAVYGRDFILRGGVGCGAKR